MYLQAELAQLDRKLAAGMQVLVPNFRSSRQLQDALLDWRRTQGGTTVLATPGIVAVDLWFSSLWQRLALHVDSPGLQRSLLTPLQEELLWQRAIDASPAGQQLLNTTGTAQECLQAWRLLLQWRLPRNFLRRVPAGTQALHDAKGSDLFADWALRFETLCEQLQVESFSSMLERLLQLCREQPGLLRRCLPARLGLWGFTEPPPLYRELFVALAEAGLPSEALEFTCCTPHLRHVQCPQPDDEAAAAVRWAATVLARQPDAVIGIICPDLPARAPGLQRLLSRNTRLQGRYQIALQQNLGSTGFAHCALLLLQLHDSNCDTLLLCELLRSPWLQGQAAEADGRAAMERQLRERGELRCNVARWLESCQPRPHWRGAPLLAGPLLKYRAGARQAPARRPLQHWLLLFRSLWDELLDTAALAGGGAGAELRAWHHTIEAVQSCRHLQGSCTLNEAISAIGRYVRGQALPTSQTPASVLVLTPLASAGLRFTHLWCLGMNERHWPAESSPSPFLPLALQQQAGLPGTEPAANLQQAREQVAALVEGTQAELVFSHAAADEDLPLRASRLVPPLDTEILATDGLPGSLHPLLRQLPHAGCIQTPAAMQVPLRADSSTRGGSTLLQDQAHCPFRAFAKARLQAAEFPAPAYGLPAAAAGACLHRVFEHFWQGLEGSAALAALSTEALTARIRSSVARALQETAQEYPTTLTPRLRNLEQQRLELLVQDWLQEEGRRGPFRVQASEQRLYWDHAGLRIGLRIDRLDTDAQGHSVVVDYKSGKVPRVDWLAGRQYEPQLPLYLLAVEAAGAPPVSALLHARVNVEACAYSGIGVSKDIHPDIDCPADAGSTMPDWASLKQQWQEQLGLLADEYLAGRVDVAPLRRDSCSHCHLTALCRIGEQRSNAPTDEDSDEEPEAAP